MKINSRTSLGVRYARMKSYTCKDWKRKLEPIECEYLKAKLATILWWDHVNDLPGDQKYLNEIRKKYHLSNEIKVTDDQLKEALIKIGYKKYWAEKRSKTPLNHRGIRHEPKQKRSFNQINTEANEKESFLFIDHS